MCFSRISRLVPLLCCVFLASTTSASKTTRRFFGLPGTGERVNYSNASENNKTLIIRHNLPVSDHRLIQLKKISTMLLYYSRS